MIQQSSNWWDKTGQEDPTSVLWMMRFKAATCVQFVSQARFNAGDWVLMGALVDTFQDAWVDDMDFHGTVTNSWIITQLEVDGVP